MVITNRSLVILAVVAAALLVVTVLLHSGGRRSETTFQKGALLIQGLDPAKVARITLEKDGKTLTLVRGGEGFVVGERSGYAASTKKLNELLIKCLDVRCAAKITDSPDNFKELGVGKDKPATIAVRFKDAEDKTLVGLIVGKSPERSGGNYVRLAGSDAVYASEKHLSFNAEAAAYMNTEIVKVSKDDVRSVTVGLKEGTYTVARDKDGKITLQDVPKGKHAKKWEVDNVFGAFSSLTFSDVMRASDVKVDIEATYTCRLESSLAYVAHLGRKDDKKCLKLSATAPPKESISVKIAKDEEKSELKKKEAILAAPEKAKAFSLKHKDWVYVIPDWKAEHLRKPLSELVEDIPKPDEPEEVAASHILIGYKDADRSEQTRSKEDAKKLAGEVLKKAKAKDADFAALAKEYSDGPSKDKGGDLGTFKKGAMHKNFEEAAWKLKVDEISDIVETPFGFHVIKRTK